MDELHDFVEQTMKEGFEKLRTNQREALDALMVQNEKSWREIEALHAQLQQAKNEGYQELLRCQKAEQNAEEAEQRAKIAELLLTEEKIARKKAQNAFVEQSFDMNRLKEQLNEALENTSSLETEILGLNSLLDEMLRDQQTAGISHGGLESGPAGEVEPVTLTWLTRNQLIEATSNFSHSLKIGNGGLGSVYKGWVQSKMVAIKVLKGELLHQNNFVHALRNLLKIQHRHLASPTGACLRPQALLYDYLLNGSLEDRLVSKDGIRPLTWKCRIQLATEICSGLILLHSRDIIHGSLKPTNVLLDGNLKAKIINFGISHLFVDHYFDYVNTDPGGLYFYMDPEFLDDGRLTKQVDVYSFGVIILRLLTARPASRLVEEVQRAVVSSERLKEIIDPMAGDWPYVNALKFAKLGLDCCKAKREARADLKSHVWRTLRSINPSTEIMEDCPSTSVDPREPREPREPPSYFVCPILQDTMRDPHFAADGFTYEAEALRAWFNGGHDTSPMTNLQLEHLNLVPNRALRSAIEDWLEDSNS